MKPSPQLEDWLAAMANRSSHAGRPEQPRSLDALPDIPDHELVRRIGHGAYGEVWLARTVLGTYRAVKIVFRDSFSSDQPYEREFRGIQRFEPVSRTNDGLMDILQVGRHDGQGCFYYVMEPADDVELGTPRVPGLDDLDSYVPKTLAILIRERRRLPVAYCIQLGLSLTSALGHLHRHGLIHRDIKPSNIIFVQGMAKLADIGLVAEVEEAMSYVGTEGFIPPEGPTSPRADLYSLGKVLYEAGMGKDRTEYPEPMTGLMEALDRAERESLMELNAVILKACEESITERYQSADEMHVDLALVQSGRSVIRRRLVEKRLAIARKIAVVVAVIAGLATGAFFYQRERTSEAQQAQQREETLRQRAEDLLAHRDIQNAEHLLQNGDSSLGLAHLADVLRRHRGNRVAAERLLSALARRHFPRLLTKPFAHEASINVARWSPDGTLVATASEDHLVRIWNAETGEQTITPPRHEGPVTSVEFSPDGSRLVSASSDRTVQVWDARSGASVFPPFRHDEPVKAAIFSPDGKWIATAGADGEARVFDAATGEPHAGPLAHVGPVNAIAFSPDSERLATAMEGGGVRIWDVTASREEHRFSLDGPVKIVRFSPDGTRLAASVYQRHDAGVWLVRVWNAESREPVTPEPVIATLFHQNRIYSLEFSPDSERLVTATTNDVARVWRIASGEELFQLRHSSLVHSAAFSPDGGQILTASADHTARLWNASTGAALSEPMLHDGRAMRAAFSRNGKQVLTVGREDRVVKVWDIRRRDLVETTLEHERWVLSAGFESSGHAALTATGGVSTTASNINSWGSGGQQFIFRWDLVARTPKLALELPPGTEAVTAQFTRSGPKALVAERLESLAFSRSARIWDLTAGEPAGAQIELDGEIACAHFSADGLRLATGSSSGTVMIWDTVHGAARTPPLAHGDSVNCVRFSPDGTALVTAGNGGTAVVWNAVTGEPLAQLGHSAA